VNSKPLANGKSKGVETSNPEMTRQFRHVGLHRSRTLLLVPLSHASFGDWVMLSPQKEPVTFWQLVLHKVHAAVGFEQ
jgi:hypothetical protein